MFNVSCFPFQFITTESITSLQSYSSRHSAAAHTYFDSVVHLGGHEFAGCHDDIFALLAGKVTVDVPGIFEQVCGIAMQIFHLLQRLLKLLSFFDHLEHIKQKIYSVKM